MSFAKDELFRQEAERLRIDRIGRCHWCGSDVVYDGYRKLPHDVRHEVREDSKIAGKLTCDACMHGLTRDD